MASLRVSRMALRSCDRSIPVTAGALPWRNRAGLPIQIAALQFAFRNKNRLFRAGDRWFESISLQRRVRCELEGLPSIHDVGQPLTGRGSTGKTIREFVIVSQREL